ncbi:alpha/beta-hydrolase [Naviculisporaceae sp. PSN 640]
MKLSILSSASLALLPGLGTVDGLVTRSKNGKDILTPRQATTTCHGIENAQDPSVTLANGLGTVHGIIEPSAPCVRQFLGIPYGRPPLGQLRFAPPQPAPPFGDLDAKELPPSCMQYLMESPPDIYTRNVLEYNLQGLNSTSPRLSEECLTLSVWTPVLPSHSNSTDWSDSHSHFNSSGARPPLPVLMFIYGGAFVTGGQDVPYQIPTNWVERTQDHIVVTFNYRLNIFGFPNAAGLPASERNPGLLDQRLAVEWVHNNIAAFGGDPSRITLWGQSAGGISAGYYQYAYPKDPLVNGIIMDSGTEMLGSPLFSDPTHSNFSYVAAHFGCNGGGSPTSEAEALHEVECMRGSNISALEVEHFIQTHDEELKVPYIFFAPQVDNVTVFTAADYVRRSEAGEVAEVPTIVGSNAEDGVAFVYLTPEGVNSTMAYAVTLGVFFCTGFAAAKNRLLAPDVPVFRYIYEGNFTSVSPQPFLGAYHSSELPMLFGTWDEFRSELNTPEEAALAEATSNAMQDAWVAFAAHGAAGLERMGWPRYTGGANQVEFFGGDDTPMRVGDTTAMEETCPKVAEMLG